jgi:pimeloyl-ACP methyl ester carboxylesterase
MGTYAEVNHIRTWYDERGNGEPLVLLHGGFSDSRDFAGNLDTLTDRFHLFLPERWGHGHTPDVDGEITNEVMAEDTIAFIDEIVRQPAHVVGYSDGATVATLAAVRRSDLVRRLVLISGGFHPSGWVFLPDADAEMPPQIVEAYRQVSPDGVEHSRSWPHSSRGRRPRTRACRRQSWGASQAEPWSWRRTTTSSTSSTPSLCTAGSPTRSWR